ncbi:peptide ABC transporter substrate-binding protein [Streptococcus oralis]|uniref:peptide ABC transporter substrate-binding protein n=1 Tax=Streptococcus oralis TaxID=1303 RepID=UPI0001E540E2|nr:peptide ABC transporter substrate-binding protein [Streptococcus oralis]EFO02426.1 bacterial extracellular solute-binding protein, family 5 [Streptococcus oralis ATCC 35037]KZX03364.1 peptide ABC transporter ATP-binding protein [Streptococcus oralis]OOR78783.1 peptide ABC transporter ATP-binding protein [Streptococcus oralis]QQB72496.1 peptide ABC transporter substrate-binding protein [Streptococcus oralis]VEF78370.1 oligopeptide ABC transporter oligopeptide-binding protein AliA [Streptococ
MKSSKLLALAGVTLLAAATLAACSGSSSNAKGEKTFSYIYETDPDNLNYLTTGKAATANITSNVIDGLLENDRYGNFVPSMAENWSVSKDGLTYTYTLRKDAKWYTSEGEEYAEVKAQDFVTGLKYAADKKSDGLYLVQESIKGLDAYVKGEITDFSQVGIKALDDYTVQYTLNKPESFWNSKTTMGVLAPVNEEFLNSKGDDFAKGTDPSSILYNGPFLLKSIVAKSSVEFEKNPNYWDKDNVHLDKVKLSFWDGQDTNKPTEAFKDGSFTMARLFPTSASYSETEKTFKDNIVYTQQDSTTYLVGTNIDRQSYKYTSKTTDEEKVSTKKALLNKDFRQAIAFGFDRTAYASQVNGASGATKLLRNLFVPPTFVQADGKNFGELVKEKLVTYGDEWSNVNLDDAQDGLYNPDKAKAEFAKAKAALQAEGVKFPIHLDMPVDQTNTTKVQRVQSFKQSVEENLGSDNVVIDIQQLQKDDVQNITYFAETAAGEDWDISDNVGWSPDYIDPSTYLDIIKPSVGENTKTYLGFDSGTNNAAAKQVGLEDYEKMVVEAGEETTDVSKRYEKYAAAQAWLTDSALLIPTTSQTGRPMLSKMVPFTLPFAYSGNKGMSEALLYKYLEVQDKAVTTEEYQKAQEKWLKEKEESNKKAQEELANHVK